MLLDGVGSAPLADSLVEGLRRAGRVVLRVHAEDFQRPAGERYAWGREDVEALRTSWLDAQALEREVLRRSTTGTYLPALRDAARDRSARRVPEPVPVGAVLLVDGVFLLGKTLSAELALHIALSPAALVRRGVPAWQLPAFADYDAINRPRAACNVLVRAEDPLRPAVELRMR